VENEAKPRNEVDTLNFLAGSHQCLPNSVRCQKSHLQKQMQLQNQDHGKYKNKNEGK
jgi:hypothetical protein